MKNICISCDEELDSPDDWVPSRSKGGREFEPLGRQATGESFISALSLANRDFQIFCHYTVIALHLTFAREAKK